jgi:hypothetical protein
MDQKKFFELQRTSIIQIKKANNLLVGDLDITIFNAVAASISKWQTFKLLK